MQHIAAASNVMWNTVNSRVSEVVPGIAATLVAREPELCDPTTRLFMRKPSTLRDMQAAKLIVIAP